MALLGTLFMILYIILPVLVFGTTFYLALKCLKNVSIGKRIASWISPIVFGLVSIYNLFYLFQWIITGGISKDAGLIIMIFFTFTWMYVIVYGIALLFVKLLKK
jgi:hypothetical protein